VPIFGSSLCHQYKISNRKVSSLNCSSVVVRFDGGLSAASTVLGDFTVNGI